jgi:methionyl-tRNA formyltransferase
VHNFIRGLSPYPGAWTLLDGRVLKIYRTTVSDKCDAGCEPGTVRVAASSLRVATRDAWLELLELKPEGKRAMTAAEFMRGHSLAQGTRLG